MSKQCHFWFSNAWAVLAILFCLSFHLTVYSGQSDKYLPFSIDEIDRAAHQLFEIEKGQMVDQDSALHALERMLRSSKNLGDEFGIANCQLQMAQIHHSRKAWRKAIRLAKNAISKATEIDQDSLRLGGNLLLSDIYQGRKQRDRLAQVRLEIDRLTNKFQLVATEKALKEMQKRQHQESRQLAHSESGREMLQKELAEVLGSQKMDAAKLARLAQEKAELELKTVQNESDLYRYRAEIERQKMVKSMLFILVVVLSLLGFLTFQIRRFKVRRAAEIEKTRRYMLLQERMASLGQLTAGIAHEIQNPLNFVNNFAEGSVELCQELVELLPREAHRQNDMIQVSQDYISELGQNAQDIRENGQRINRIVSSMMDHVKDHQGEIQKCDINAIVHKGVTLAYQSYHTLHPNFTAEIKESYNWDLQLYEGVPQDLNRVIINLVGNACHAMHQKQIEDSKGYKPLLVTSTKKSEQALGITIRDNGIGISTSTQKKIFTPFFSTKPDHENNAGLGLSISHDIIVHGHQGKIEINSLVDEFTEFTILLPI